VHFYLIQLSYTADAWRQQIEQTRNAATRLAAVKQLIAHLGGSLAHYHFFADEGRTDQETIVITDKFIGFGHDDIVAVMAMPDHASATAFSMAVSAESGVRDVRLTPITPIAEAIASMAKAHDARRQTSYSAPGGAATNWIRPVRGSGGETRKRRAPAKKGSS
jgi:uncharacterized protein with GYD domain